ncbi:disulfide bond formation protein D precursor [archaeon BMS3Bbin15]|nr:disulfide bond formation protein D precursor [archaeon BMS3Bbin15]
MESKEAKLIALGLLVGIVIGAITGSFIFSEQRTEKKSSVFPMTAGDNAMNFINSRLLQPKGFDGRINSMKEYGELYELNIDIMKNGQVINTRPIWITKDGKILIFDLLNMSEALQERPAKEPAKVNVTADDSPYIGPKNASVVIIEFSDYQCPFCKRFYEQTQSKILKAYGNKIKFVFRDFPIHPLSTNASLAADCAGEQNKYFKYHNLLFANVNEWSKTGNFSKYAEELDLNMTEFNSCFTSQEYINKVKQDKQAGIKAGVRGTPTFFINGILLSGNQPYSAFKTIIDSELNK